MDRMFSMGIRTPLVGLQYRELAQPNYGMTQICIWGVSLAGCRGKRGSEDGSLSSDIINFIFRT